MSATLRLACAAALAVGFATRLKADDAAALTPRDVMEKWIQQLGGHDALRAVDEVSIESHLEASGSPSIEINSVETRDGRYRYDWSGPETISGASDGQRAWHQNSTLGFGYITRDESLPEFWSAGILQAESVLAHSDQAQLLTPVNLRGQVCWVVQLPEAEWHRALWYISQKNGELVRLERPATPGRTELNVDYSDFRKAGKLILPFRATLKTGSASATLYRFNISFDSTIEPEVFQPRPADRDQGKVVDDLIASYRQQTFSNRAVTTRVTTATVTMQPSGQVKHIVISEKKPRLLREETLPGLGRTLIGFNGTVGWLNGEIQGFRWLKPVEIAELQGDTLLQPVANFGDVYPVRRYIGRIDLNGTSTIAIGMNSAWAPGATFYFAENGNRLLRVETDTTAPSHEKIHAIVDYADYRHVGDVWVPFETIWKTAINSYELHCESVVFDVPLSDALFEPQRGDL